MKGVTTLLEFQDVKWQLPSGEPIIKGITCKLDSRLTVITGPNGGGKTSLAKLIAGVEKCTSGKILLDGTDITDMDITGRAKLGIKERPKDTPTRQACAAVGQCELMYLYDNLFSEYSLNVAQLLLTKYILLEDRRINVQNALNRIIELGSIPIVNENDTVSIDELELEMGENDSLAANVAVLANADLLIIMSDIEGLFDKDPHKYDDAELIPVVPEITEEIKAIAGGAGSSLGTGGMATKIKAAEICKNGGIDLIIMNGRDPRHLYKVFENKPIGTLFTANGEV